MSGGSCTPRAGPRGSHLGTRIVAIPVSLLRKLGFDMDDEIYGRWSIKGDKLVLGLKREVEVEQRFSEE